MVSERVKKLREQNNLTQADLARKLGLTRSSVNAWEMGISVPSTQYIVELAKIFKVSTDYLLGVSTENAISTEGLVKEDIEQVYSLVEYLRLKNKKGRK